MSASHARPQKDHEKHARKINCILRQHLLGGTGADAGFELLAAARVHIRLQVHCEIALHTAEPILLGASFVMANGPSAWDGRSPPLVLTLTGGGFRGYFTALVLAQIEEMIGARCHLVFNLIAGTSIGGIIAIGLAFGIPARDIAALIFEFGPSIFPPFRFKNARRVFGPPYTTKPIEEALSRLLPRQVTRPLGEALQNVMVISASPATGQMEVISSWDSFRTAAMSVRDAALVTSAAPTYFPAHRARLGVIDIDLVDGGVAANAPDGVAIHQGVKHLSFSEDRIAMLSIGTCAPIEGAAGGLAPARVGTIGALKKLGGRGIVNFMMAIQEHRGTSESEVRLGQARYLRIDKSPSFDQAKFLELDNASEQTKTILKVLADSVISEQLKNQNHSVWQDLHARAQAVR